MSFQYFINCNNNNICRNVEFINRNLYVCLSNSLDSKGKYQRLCDNYEIMFVFGCMYQSTNIFT